MSLACFHSAIVAYSCKSVVLLMMRTKELIISSFAGNLAGSDMYLMSWIIVSAYQHGAGVGRAAEMASLVMTLTCSSYCSICKLDPVFWSVRIALISSEHISLRVLLLMRAKSNST